MDTLEKIEGLSILGLRNVRINDVDTFIKKVKSIIHPVRIQMVDASRIAGFLHIQFAFINAQKSFEQRRAISENLEMETLLYASGQRQISKAIEMLGIRPTTSEIVVLLFISDKNEVGEIGKKLMDLTSGTLDSGVLEIHKRTKIENLIKTFKVTKLEFETMSGYKTNIKDSLIWLIVERVSLLSTQR